MARHKHSKMSVRREAGGGARRGSRGTAEGSEGVPGSGEGGSQLVKGRAKSIRR